MAPQTEWFIEPLDALTNRVVAEEIGQAVEESAMDQILARDGSRRRVWRCAYAVIRSLERNRALAHLHYNIFVRRGSFGDIMPDTFVAQVVRRRGQTDSHNQVLATLRALVQSRRSR